MSNYFAGLDWASKTHALCVIDERGDVVERFEIAHDAAGIAELKRRLCRWGSPREGRRGDREDARLHGQDS